MKSKALLGSTLEAIVPVDHTWTERARERQKALTKPEGSLGRLEEIANRLCSIQKTLTPSAANPQILLFAADHGVCAEGISAFPQSVTAQMVLNFLRGGAAINALAQPNNIKLLIVDIGIESPVSESPALIQRRIGNGTRNLARHPAMTRREAIDAIAVGIESTREAAREGAGVVGIGEMGIGNTTPAAAITAALTQRSAAEVVGRGTGIDDITLARKIDTVTRAVLLHRPQNNDAIDILSTLGGFEIAAMCGVCIGAASLNIAVVVDGFISTCAAALATRMHPDIREYLITAHKSTESGHGALLELIDHEPLLDLGMRLGEGTGAALGVGLIRSAVAAFNEMSTFADASVSESN